MKELPQLDAPGKGLPRIELMIARMLVGWQARRTTRGEADAVFGRERDAILRIARSVSEEQGRRRVLIDRLRGLEDSSRHWSVFMTVQHVRIVNRGIWGIVSTLARGELPSRVVSTADVKPSDSAGISEVDLFESESAQFLRDVADIPDLATSLTWAHPWFGELDAARWHFFAGFHLALHRKQLSVIADSIFRA